MPHSAVVPSPAAAVVANVEPCEELCDLCGGGQADKALEDAGRFLLRCRACGLVRLSPQPSLGELSAVYDHGGYYTTRPPQQAHGFAERLREAVLEAYWGYPSAEFSPVSNLLARSVLWPLKNRVMPVRFPVGQRVLDVGCGNGQRLADLERYGHRNLFGVEPTAEAAELARRSTCARVFTGVLEEAGYPSGYFGLVILNQVLEHVPSPTATLREIHRVLAPGGRLYLTVPNFGSLEAKLCGRHWAGLRLPEHLHHFTAEPLRRMLEKAQFRIEIWRTDTVPGIARESAERMLTHGQPGGLARRVAVHVAAALLPLAATAADVLRSGQMIRVVAAT